MRAPVGYCVAVIALALSGCERPVGYQGPLPSVEARQTLRALEGARLPAGRVRFTSHELVVRDFLVRPDGPTVIVEEVRSGDASTATARYWIPVLSDGDVADLHRLTGRDFPLAHSGELSSAYRRYTRGE